MLSYNFILQKSKLFIITTAIVALAAALYAQSSVMAQTVSSFSPSVVGTQQPSSLNNIFKQAENSILQITSKIPTTTSNPLNPESQNATTALGSGFVYDKMEYCRSEQLKLVCAITGHIITNNHVVADAKVVDVTFADGNRYTAIVTGTDIYSDIAVLQIIENVSQQPSLKPLVIANSSNLEVGEPIVAIGNPFGLGGTITTGIVSGIGRLLPAAAGPGFSIPNVVQTDVPINPGDSGGPLLNMQGQVVGINSAIGSSTGGFSGIAFAIPSNTITRIVPALIERGYYLHPYLGLAGATITSDLAKNITEIPAASNFKGIYVDTITKDGPADKAGIHGSTIDQYSKKHAGDIIIAADGHPLVRIDDLISYLDQYKSADGNITLTVYRNGHDLDLKVTLAARPSPLPSLTISSSPLTQPPQPAPSPLPRPYP